MVEYSGRLCVNDKGKLIDLIQMNREVYAIIMIDACHPYQGEFFYDFKVI